MPHRVRSRIHRVDPHLTTPSLKPTHHTWDGNHKTLSRLVREAFPNTRERALAVEVGSWEGVSAINIVKTMLETVMDPELVCIDTWTGAWEMWIDKPGDNRYDKLRIENGMPRIYDQFMSNIAHAELQPYVTPFPVPSTTGARVLRQLGFRPDFIYIDGSHLYKDVTYDLEVWTPLCKHIVGHDWNLANVQRAVVDFHDRTPGTELDTHDGIWWRLRR